MKILYGKDLVNELRRRSDEIKKRMWIAVPYIGGLQSVLRIIGNKWTRNSNLSVRLLTDISASNSLSSETIKLFNAIGTIRHLLGLHAKIYITDNQCLITSANLTNTAFSKRHEIGIFLDNTNSRKAIKIFDNWWRKSKGISATKLKKFARKTIVSTEEKRGISFPSLWRLPEEPHETKYWLKPIGSTGEPIEEHRRFDKKNERMHFSKVKPTGVAIGDILIVYGVGAKRILSIYEVASGLRFDNTNKRWPWFVVGRNLTPKFGRSWVKHSIYAEDLRNDYLKKHAKNKPTRGGTFGGLNLGKDKLRLSAHFAEYVIQRIKNMNDAS